MQHNLTARDSGAMQSYIHRFQLYVMFKFTRPAPPYQSSGMEEDG